MHRQAGRPVNLNWHPHNYSTSINTFPYRCINRDRHSEEYVTVYYMWYYCITMEQVMPYLYYICIWYIIYIYYNYIVYHVVHTWRTIQQVMVYRQIQPFCSQVWCTVLRWSLYYNHMRTYVLEHNGLRQGLTSPSCPPCPPPWSPCRWPWTVQWRPQCDRWLCCRAVGDARTQPPPESPRTWVLRHSWQPVPWASPAMWHVCNAVPSSVVTPVDTTEP